MPVQFKVIYMLAVVLLAGAADASEYYKIDRGLFTSEFFMIRIDSTGFGQVNRYERLRDGIVLLRHQDLKCTKDSCVGGVFFWTAILLNSIMEKAS